MPRLAHPTRSPVDAASADPQDAPLAHALDISFCTHLTVVVPVRLDFAGGDPHDVTLVLPRARSDARRPCLRALLDAAQTALARTRSGRRPQRLSARIDGQWRALFDWPDGAAVAMPSAPLSA
jgi:hypothetical protein